MNEKTIKRLPNSLQHVLISLQEFPSYSMRESKNRYFHVPQPTFLFPLETPLRLLRNMLHGLKDNSMLAKRLAVCTTVAITLNVIWMEREFDAYKLSRWMCPSNYNRFSDTARYWSKIVIFHTPLDSTPPLAVFPSEHRHPVWYGKTRMMWLPDGEKISKTSLFVSVQLTNVTDRHWVTAIAALCIASHGKNGLTYRHSFFTIP